MTETHDWPMERGPRGPNRRPWIFSASGFLALMFKDGKEADRARAGLLDSGVSENDIRLYQSEEILESEERFMEERPRLAKAVAATFGDREARKAYFDNARAGGAALWLYAPTEKDAEKLMHVLADYDYFSLRYFDEEGISDVALEEP